MSQETLVERFFEILINGDRPAARAMIDECAREGCTPERILSDLCWPTYEFVGRLHRADQLSQLSYRLSTRLLRVMVDQLALRLTMQPRSGKSVFAVCGPTDADELGAQIAVDLLEASGFRVTFAGGGLPGDEILAQVHESSPDVLVMFASAPSDLPEIRGLIDTLREIGARPGLQIAVGGGVFNRAEGLAEEIGLTLWATNPLGLVDVLTGRVPCLPAAPARAEVAKKRRTKAAA